MKNISQQAKRILSLVLALTILLTTVSISLFVVSAADVEYTDKFTIYNYAYLENDDGDRLELKEAIIPGPGGFGYHPAKAGTDEFVAGSIVYRVAYNIKDVEFVTGLSDNSWIGKASFYGSTDGKNWISLDTTRRFDEAKWIDGNAHFFVYDTVSFENEQSIHYLKVTLKGNAFAQGPGFREIRYTEYTERVSSHDNSFGPTEYVASESEGTYQDMPEVGMGFRNFSNGKGTVTFAATGYAPITDFAVEMIIHNQNLNSVKIEASSDGTNFTAVPVLLDRQDSGFYNPSWDCSYYTVYGIFNADENVRFVRVTVRNTIAHANAIRTFYYNTGENTIEYLNTLDYMNGEAQDGYYLQYIPVANGDGGYALTHSDAETDKTETTGYIDYYIENGISDFCFQSVNFYGDISASFSIDKTEWVKPKTINAFVRSGYNNDINLSVYSHAGAVDPSAGYKYVRLSFHKGGIGFLPALIQFKYNTSAQFGGEFTDYTVSMRPTDGTPTGSGTLKSCSDIGFGGWDGCGSYYLFADGNNQRVLGTLDFHTDEAITDYRVTVMDAPNAANLKLWALMNGSWVVLNPEIMEAGKSPNTDWAAWPYYLYGTLDNKANIRDLRVEYTGFHPFVTLPAVSLVEFNTVPLQYEDPSVEDAEMQEILKKSMKASDATPKSDGTLKSCSEVGFGGWLDCEKYYAFVDENNNNAWVSGTLDFYSEEAFTDYRFKVFDDKSASHVKLYASADNEVWIPINAKVAKAGASPNPDWGDTAPYYMYGTIKESADIHYLRVELASVHWMGRFPALCSLEYNDASTALIEKISDMTERYEHRAYPPDALSTESEYPLTNMYGIGDNLSYNVYAFWDSSEWKKGGANIDNAWKPGSIIYYSEDAITDYRVKGIWSGVDGDKINVYGSADGTKWVKLSVKQAEVGDFSNPNWGAFTSKWYYGSFKENTDIHYIRVEMVSRVVWLRFLPGICFLDYNTVKYNGLPVRPDSYVNTSVESNYFLQDDQYITFKSGSATTDYDLWLKPVNGQTPKIYLSRDNNNWTESAAIAESLGGGLYSYYDGLKADDGIYYIKIDKSTAKFEKLRYNISNGGADSTRRHYEMPELVDDIEDLPLKSVDTPFNKFNTHGALEFTDMAITANNSNASFIGGEYGIVGLADISSVLMEAPNVRDFKIRGAFGTSIVFSHIKAYGRTSLNGEETEIPLMRIKAPDFDMHGFANYIFRPSNRDALTDAGYHYIRIELAQEYITMQQVLDFVYFYDLPDLVPMPDFKKPDASKGEIELMDVFDSAQLTIADDGKAETAVQLHKEDVAIGRNNPGDRVLIKDYYMAESFIVYKVPDLNWIDIRAYKSAECFTDLVISVSKDGENWTEIKITPFERDIYDGWRKAAYRADISRFGRGMHYVKIEIPDLDGVESDLMISDIQLIHTGTDIPVISDEIEDDPIYVETPNDEEEQPVVNEINNPGKPRKKVTKVVKTINYVMPWWSWVLIALGVVAVIGGGLATFFIIRAKRRKKAAATP